MEQQDIIQYLNALVDNDPTLSMETRIVLKEAVAKLEAKISVEERTQIIILLVTLLLNLGNKLGGGT